MCGKWRLRKHAVIAEAFGRHPEKMPLVPYVRLNEAREITSARSVDFIFSQVALEHADDLKTVYRNLFEWLSPVELMSHQVDFRSHGTSHIWNGHCAYSDWLWRPVRGNRHYLINREPCGTHFKALKEAGFVTLSEERIPLPSPLR